MRLHAFVLTCPERAPLLANTLASLDASDWGTTVDVVLNDDGAPDRRDRQAAGALALLERARDSGADVALLLEDDVAVNRHLRHNLLAWAPLARSDGGCFFGSLYDPGLPAVSGRPTPTTSSSRRS